MSTDSDFLDAVSAHLRRGERDRAVALARRDLGRLTRHPEALLRAASGLHDLGLRNVADAAFHRALQRAPADANLRFRHAVYQLVTGRPAHALAIAESLCASHEVAELHALRGLALRRLGRMDAAALAYQQALRTDPERVEWWNHVGDLRLDQRRLEDAIRAYNAALLAARRREDVGPDILAYTLTRLSDCFAKSNLIEEAWRFSEAALDLQPDNPRARWTDLHLLPIIYPDSDSLDRARERYHARLDALDRDLVLDDPRQAAATVAGMKLPFYLHYQGGDMRPIMERFGGIVDRCVRAWRPDLASPPRPEPPTDRIRVGFCSQLFRRHTVSKLFGSWLSGLDRTRFEVFVYHLGPEVDETTHAIEASADHFVHLVGAPADEVCERMRADGLHVAVYPELGMAITTYQVAALRAAPIQAVAWGHPITTGLPSVDLFLTSDAMEPDDGESQYTERLVRLPGLSIRPTRPTAASGRDRASFGLDEDDIVFLVPQSLFKLLPDADALYAQILQRVHRARLVFLHNASDVVTGRFQQRLLTVLRAHAVDRPEHRLVFVPQLSWEDYLALNAVADVFLDGISWSGGMTSLEALAEGLVPVTLPGDTMRARHTAAILRKVGLDETIASDRADYVELAVRLGTDAAWRRELSARARTGLEALYRDDRPIRALADVLETAVHDAFAVC